MAQWILKHFVSGDSENVSPKDRSRVGTAASIVGIIANIALCLMKGLVGLMVGSVSIVADAVNNLSDASSNIISFLGFKLASRPADDKHPYGHGRYEYLSGLVVATLVSAIGIELVLTSVDKIMHPQPTDFGVPVIVVLVLSILIKLWLAHFNRVLGRAISSTTLEATAVDARNDVISTAGVLVAAALSDATGFDLDGWAGVVIGAFVIFSGLSLIRDTLNPLLGQAPDPALVKHIHDTIMSYPGVLGTHDLMVHDYGPGRLVASAHVEMAAEENPMESHDTIDNIEEHFRQEGLIVILHYDPIVTNDESVKTMRGWIAEAILSIDQRLTIHDLRTVPGPTHTNVIFDVVRPHDLPLDDDELRDAISKIVTTRYPHAICKITVDSSYVSAV